MFVLIPLNVSTYFKLTLWRVFYFPPCSDMLKAEKLFSRCQRALSSAICAPSHNKKAAMLSVLSGKLSVYKMPIFNHVKLRVSWVNQHSLPKVITRDEGGHASNTNTLPVENERKEKKRAGHKQKMKVFVCVEVKYIQIAVGLVKTYTCFQSLCFLKEGGPELGWMNARVIVDRARRGLGWPWDGRLHNDSEFLSPSDGWGYTNQPRPREKSLAWLRGCSTSPFLEMYGSAFQKMFLVYENNSRLLDYTLKSYYLHLATFLKNNLQQQLQLPLRATSSPNMDPRWNVWTQHISQCLPDQIQASSQSCTMLSLRQYLFLASVWVRGAVLFLPGMLPWVPVRMRWLSRTVSWALEQWAD